MLAEVDSNYVRVQCRWDSASEMSTFLGRISYPPIFICEYQVPGGISLVVPGGIRCKSFFFPRDMDLFLEGNFQCVSTYHACHIHSN